MKLKLSTIVLIVIYSVKTSKIKGITALSAPSPKYSLASINQRLFGCLSFNLYCIMEAIRKKQRSNIQRVRKQVREEMMSQKREWFEPPSPVFELPFRFHHQEWTDFEVMLDSFSQKEVELVDEAYKAYLLSQWCELEVEGWDNEKALNVLRVLFRLHLAGREHIASILKLAMQAKKAFQQNGCLKAATVLLKILKEVTISLQTSGESLWEGDLAPLNSLISSLQIQRTIWQQGNESLGRIFEDYRIYYMVLLGEGRVSVEQFVKIRNAGELYYLINDCINQSDSFQLATSIRLISKIIKIKGDDEVRKCVKGLSVLLTEGIDPARLFLEDKPYEEKRQGLFFAKLLPALSRTDLVSLLSALQLLALLFDSFDQCIPAAFAVLNPVKSTSEEKENSHIQFVREREYGRFSELIESLMENIVLEVRVKTYWVVSNITGSSIYYRQFGLPFITHIYTHQFLNLESHNQTVSNEITICILNYLCNLNSLSEIDQLLSITPAQTESHPPNCLVFCLQATLSMLQRIGASGEERSGIYAEEGIMGMVHRSLYALFGVLENAGANEEMIVGLLEQGKCRLTVQKILGGLETYVQHEEVCQLANSVLAKLEGTTSL